jgi:aspartyl-tRNA synthetase
MGAGPGSGFQDTHELHVMKYEQAMKSKDKKLWIKAVDEEHGHMEKYKVFKTVKKSTLPNKAKVLSSTWAMKKKSIRTYRAQVTTQGYKLMVYIMMQGISSLNEADLNHLCSNAPCRMGWLYYGCKRCIPPWSAGRETQDVFKCSQGF